MWLTRLDPTEANEIRKNRPCLVVSSNGMNRFLGTTIVIPMTSGSEPARFRVASDFRSKPGLLLGDQLRSVARSRLLKHLGTIDPATLAATLAVLREMFEAED